MRREHVAGVRAEVPDHRLGRLGHAALRPGAALRRRRAARLRRDRRGASAATWPTTRCCSPGIALALAGLAFKASVAPFHQWTPDVYEGAPTPITAFMAVATKAAAFGVILRLFDVALIDAHDDLGAGARGAGRDHDHRRQRRRARAVVAQAPAGLVLRRAGRLPARRRRRRDPARRRGHGLLPRHLPRHEPGGFAVIIARERETGLGDDISVARRPRRDRPLLAWPMTIAMLSLAGFPATAGLLRQVLPDRRRRGRRLRVARRRHRARLGDLAGLLPAGRRGDLDDAGAGEARLLAGAWPR